jgi:hypothetical protein
MTETSGIVGIVAASIGLLGLLVAAFIAALLQDRRERDATVRKACEDFLREMVALRQHAWLFVRRPGDRKATLEAMRAAEQRARFEMDRLRLLVRSTEAQYCARRVVRHSHALVLEAEAILKKEDPEFREDERCCPPARLVEDFSWRFINLVRSETRVRGLMYADPEKWRFDQPDPSDEVTTTVKPVSQEDRSRCPTHGLDPYDPALPSEWTVVAALLAAVISTVITWATLDGGANPATAIPWAAAAAVFAALTVWLTVKRLVLRRSLPLPAAGSH